MKSVNATNQVNNNSDNKTRLQRKQELQNIAKLRIQVEKMKQRRRDEEEKKFKT